MAKTHSNPASPQGQKTPSAYITQNTWRNVLPHEPAKAHKLRRALFQVGTIYPVREQSGPAYDQQEANQRALLHACADELNREDLFALAHAARLLLLIERDPGFFAWTQTQMKAELAALVAEGLVPDQGQERQAA